MRSLACNHVEVATTYLLPFDRPSLPALSFGAQSKHSILYFTGH
jgi:hypothetical protein